MARNPNHIRLTGAERVYQVVIAVIVGIVTLLCLFPFIYVVGMSLTSEGELLANNYFVIFPKHPILRTYQTVFEQSGFLHSLLISVLRTVVGPAASLLLVVPAGYILAKDDMPGHRGLVIFFVITMILNGGLIPGYLLINKLHLMNTFWVYIIPAMGNAFNMMIVKIFVEGIPGDIMESADLDGASELQKMTRIAVPLLVPTICALGLFSAVAQWNSWFDVMLYVHDANLYSMSYVIKQMMTSVNVSDTMNSMVRPIDRVTPEGFKMASIVLAVLPILCVYPFLQKYFIYGVYTGSVKG